MRRSIGVGLATWLVLASAVAGKAQAGPTIHVIVAADTLDPTVGKSVRTDASDFESMFRGNVPEGMLRVRTLDGPGCGPDAILGALDALAAGPDDTVVVYYSGHGGYDARVGSYLRFPRLKAQLTRDKLRQAIRARNARLGVLLTDCCNNAVAIPGPPTVPFKLFPPPPRVISATFRVLFLEHAGFVDITSSKQGEQSIGYPGLRTPKGEESFERGGIFTDALLGLFGASRPVATTWVEVRDATARRVAEQFRKLRPDGLENPDDPEHPQMTQTVVAYSTGTRLKRPAPTSGGAAPRPPVAEAPPAAEDPPGGEDPPPAAPAGRMAFGAAAAENRGDGVVVLFSYANTPAATIGLERGDVILSINDAPIRSVAEYFRAVATSPNPMRFTVRDVRTGAVEEYTARLDR